MTPPPAFRLVGYGKRGWNELTRKGATQPIPEDEARARHERGGPSGAYAAVLTGAPGDDVGLPIASVVVNQHGVTVSFYEHDPARPNLTVFWSPGADGRLRIAQVDRRAGNADVVGRDALVYEYVKVDGDRAVWVRWGDDGATKLGERAVDADALAVDPPPFGDYAAVLDPTVGQQLWPGLPELTWPSS